MPHRIALVAVLLLLLGADCSDLEAARRRAEGISGTPAGEALVAARIAELTERMGGAVPGNGEDISLADRLEFYDVPGVTVAVIHEGRIEWVAGFGVRSDTGGEPMPPYAFLQGASLSKVMTALGAMRAVEEGLLDLDEPVNDVLEQWQLPENVLTQNEPVTLRRLLSHTAGTNVPSFFGAPNPANLPTTLEILDGVSPASNVPIRVENEPGGEWLYSGGGYIVAQQLLEEVTGSYTGWLEEEVFGPARMWWTGFHQPAPAELLANAAVGNANGFDLAAPVTYPSLAAAGAWTNALDLARLIQAVQRSLFGEPGALLSQATAQAMLTPQQPGPPFTAIFLDPDPAMGLGLFLVDEDDPTFFWHTGENTGYTSVIVGSTKRGDGVAIMTNGQRFFFGGGRVLAWEIVDAISRIYEWGDWEGWGH